MLEWRAQSLNLGISRNAVSLVLHERRTQTWRVLGWSPLPGDEDDTDAFVPALRDAVHDLLKTHATHGKRRPTLDIVFDDRLARLWMTTPPAGASRLSDIEGAATLRFANLFGETPESWQIAGDWQVSHPFCTAALPRALVDTLIVAAQANHVAVLSIAPHFVSAWNRWHRPCRRSRTPGWFAVLHDHMLRLGITDGAHMRLLAMHEIPVPMDHDVYWLAQTVVRTSMLLGVPAATHLHLCGEVPNDGRVTLAALTIHALASPAGRTAYDWQAADILATGGAIT